MAYKEAAAPVFPIKSTLNSKQKDFRPWKYKYNCKYCIHGVPLPPPPQKRKLIAKI